MASHILLSGLYVVLVGVILLALITGRRKLRPLAILAGAIALWLPHMIVSESLGHANPFVPTGNYRLIASNFDFDRDLVYILVDGYDGLTPPRSYRIPLSDYGQDAVPEGSAYEPPDVYISRGDSGEMEMLAVDYQPQDPPKGTRNYGQIGID